MPRQNRRQVSVMRPTLSLRVVQNSLALRPLHRSDRLFPSPPLTSKACTTVTAITKAMSSPERTPSSMGSANALPDQIKPRLTLYAEPSPLEHFPSLSGFEEPQEVLSEDDAQVQRSMNPQKSQTHERMRSAKSHTKTSLPQPVASPSLAAPLSSPLSSATGVASLAAPTTHTTHKTPASDEVEEDEEVAKA